MKKSQKLLLTLSTAVSCFVLIQSTANAHTKWNYYRSNYECRSENGQGPIVDKVHCKTPDHTQKVCRAKDSHTHNRNTGTVTGPGYIDTTGDGIADTQVTDIEGGCSPCTTVANPGPIAGQSTATVGIRPDGTYSSVQTDPSTGRPVINENGNLLADPSPPHTYPSGGGGSGSGNTDMRADDWNGVLTTNM